MGINLTNPIDPVSIAIIGMACRYPRASTPEAFWANITHQIDCTTWFSPKQDMPRHNQRHYVDAKPCLDGIETFDAEFFGFSSQEATFLDPQIRLFLELAYHALEDAGYASQHPQPIGVFAGAAASVEWTRLVLQQLRSMTYSEAFESWVLSSKDFLSQIVSYRLNLTGPSYTLYTACSTSLAGIHLACQSLLQDECNMALAGGVTIDLPVRAGYYYEPGLIHSPDGVCRPFDKSSNGTLFGDGGGAIVLKRLDRALADGDQIYAVVKGSGCNNDGRRKSGFTAPSLEGQTELLQSTYVHSGIPSASIQYVEAHGTGTKIGDAIEIEALKSIYKNGNHQCALGSVKANIGHLHAAAGVAGVMKAVLALRHKIIPPLTHFASLNPEIENSGCFSFPTENTYWEKLNEEPRRAAMSSFGIGGTNVHLVLEEAPELVDPPIHSDQIFLFPLSAKTPEALKQLMTQFSLFLKDNSNMDLRAIALSLQRRPAFAHRCCLIGNSVEELLGQLPMRTHVAVNVERPLEVLAKRWEAGVSVNWQELNQVRRVSLPPYPFQRRRYWFDENEDFHPLPDIEKISDHETARFVHQRFIESLQCQFVNETDNFFRLGGDSLQLMQIVSRINVDFCVEIPLEEVMGDPTVRQILHILKRVKNNTKVRT